MDEFEKFVIISKLKMIWFKHSTKYRKELLEFIDKMENLDKE